MLGRLKRPKNNLKKEVVSPNGRVKLIFVLQNGWACYRVEKDGKVLIDNSRLGLAIQGELDLGANLMLVRICERVIKNTWETTIGEEREIENHCNETAFYLEESREDKRIFTMRVRVFDDGIAFRYEIPPQPKFRRVIIADELTEFKIDTYGQAWQIPAYQPDRYEYNYERWPVYSLHKPVHTPLTIEAPTGEFLSIHEAALYNYGSMTLKLDEWQALKADITPLSNGMKAYVDLPFMTPWRVVMIAGRAVDLVTNRVVLNLNEPPKKDFSWVKPLKFMGIWWAMYVGEWTWAPGEKHGATTEHAFEYIDQCQKLGVEGLLVEGWNNGWEGDWLKNGATSDFTKPMADFDLPKVAKYAKEQGVELVGHHETVGFVDNYERQIEAAYRYYAENGIHYIKPGYSGSMMMVHGNKEYHHSQVGVRHYQKALELAAKYKIMLDVHEPIKGTGTERTWPNMLTREGARGQEYEGGSLKPSHACILPFTRLLAGGMDYTSGIFDLLNSKKPVMTTLARQLAYYVTIYSGMQMAADRPKMYEERMNVYKFIRDVPVNWEKTVPLLGKIGEYFVVARQGRESADWFIGGVTNEQPRRVKFNLDFLSQGTYTAEIYRDADNAHYRDNPLAIDIEEKNVTMNDELELWIAAGGGFAIRLRKK